MAVNQGPLSGFRDMRAGQMIPRERMLDSIKGVCELYGFVPLKTPALERFSTLSGKYGEDGEKLIYKFEDNGGREVALRYDHTVPLARVVAQYGSELPMPYKRYAVGEVWRGERPQAGRYREFTQFDADIIGTKSPIADAEIVAMTSDSMAAIGADSLIRVNNRLILDALVGSAGIDNDKAAHAFMGSIDKVEKIGAEAVLSEIKHKYGDKAAETAGEYLAISGSSIDKLSALTRLLGPSEVLDEGVINLQAVFKILEESGYSHDKVIFDHTIARGLDYYTGIIFETVIKGSEALGSVCSGGRYDNLIKALGGPDIPAVGTSVGVDRLYDALGQLGLLKQAKTKSKVLVANFDSAEGSDYIRVASQLRLAGLPTEVYYEPTKLGKQVGYADKMGIPYVVLMGPDERAKGVATIRSLDNGEQTEVPVDELADAIQKLSE